MAKHTKSNWLRNERCAIDDVPLHGEQFFFCSKECEIENRKQKAKINRKCNEGMHCCKMPGCLRLSLTTDDYCDQCNSLVEGIMKREREEREKMKRRRRKRKMMRNGKRNKR
jgi:hypothetical protein